MRSMMTRKDFFRTLFGAAVATPICLLVKDNPTVNPTVAPTTFVIPPLLQSPLPSVSNFPRFRSRYAQEGEPE
jgi:hypothetical protein